MPVPFPSPSRPAFAACGFLSVAFYLLLSETGVTERFKDHYFVVPQLFISLGDHAGRSPTSRRKSA